jgi:hypothetical protein
MFREFWGLHSHAGHSKLAVMNGIFRGVPPTVGIKIGHDQFQFLPAVTRNSGKPIIFTAKFREMTEGI